LETLDSRRPVVGLFFDTSLVVTSASAIEVRDEVALQSVQTRDGETQDFTVLGRTTTSDNSEDLAALRVDLEAPVLPEGSAEALSAGDIVVQVGYTSALEWITQFGRIKRFTDDGRFVTSLPFQTPGGPVATLDGTLVGITTQSGEFDTPANEAPPPTAPETVYTDQSQWAGIRQEPISDVRAQVDEWTS
jgi:S1-C subfamily serine protease